MYLLGGLALFLYGMQMMSTGLESAAGNKIKRVRMKGKECILNICWISNISIRKNWGPLSFAWKGLKKNLCG